ncbi:MAG TPA: response regulator, partial [Acidimicrobiales bacterium]|nr:response regulator [Acidimicrobiales bacterium]
MSDHTPRYRVVIVEDDPMVASIHRRWIDAAGGFEVVDVVPSAELAAARLVQADVDLVILDLSLQGASGIELLRRLRRSTTKVDVIVVTAAREPATVEAVTHLGVVDYLVKPFREERFQQAMASFAARRAGLAREQLSQADIDRLRGGATMTRATPKGISPATLERVHEVLRTADGPVTASQVGERMGVSRVVARRYLEHLLETGR